MPSYNYAEEINKKVLITIGSMFMERIGETKNTSTKKNSCHRYEFIIWVFSINNDFGKYPKVIIDWNN